MSNGKKFAIAIATLLTVVSTAHAEESGWYVGAGIGQSQVDINEGPFLQKNEDWVDSWSLTGGYRFNSWFAVEVGYTSLGAAKFHSDTSVPGVFGVETRAKIEGFNTALVGSMPLGSAFDLHGRLGLLFADSELDINFPDDGFRQSASDSSQSVFYGAGVAWHASENWSLSLDYQRYTDVGDEDDSLESDVDTVGINAFFRF